MDGTIVDTENIWADATKLFIERRGIAYTGELEAALRKEIHGLALHKSCGVIKDFINLEGSVEDLIKEKSLIAYDLYKNGIKFIDGFEAFHCIVQTKNIKNGIATNADDMTVQLSNQALNLSYYFGDHIYGISCVGNICKPDPAIYLHTAEKLGIDPQECLAIEDSAHGIKAAQAAGMLCIGINTSCNYDQVKKADYIVDRYQDIDLDALLLGI
jgi:HAD superfamily hydrolase (TIGR01549 family)